MSKYVVKFYIFVMTYPFIASNAIKIILNILKMCFLLDQIKMFDELSL